MSKSPLTLGYEGAARFLMGAKSWNNLASDLKKGLVSPNIALPISEGHLDGPLGPVFLPETSTDNPEVTPGAIEVELVSGLERGSRLRYKYRILETGAERVTAVVIRANLATRPGVGHPLFSVVGAVHALSDDALTELAAKQWRDAELVLQLLNASIEENSKVPELSEFLQQVAHVPRDILLGAVRRQDVLPYVRAFRPHLLAKLLLVERYGDLDSASDAGFYVNELRLQGRWSVTACSAQVYPPTGSDHYFNGEAEAWSALFYAMVARTDAFRVGDFFRVLDGSGHYEAPGRMGHAASRKIRGWTQIAHDAHDSRIAAPASSAKM